MKKFAKKLQHVLVRSRIFIHRINQPWTNQPLPKINKQGYNYIGPWLSHYKIRSPRLIARPCLLIFYTAVLEKLTGMLLLFKL